MSKIPFKISARTAKLIGRENFTNPEGAIIELVKNSYDADAKNCLVIFDTLFENVPETLSIKEFEEYSKDPQFTKTAYKREDNSFSLVSNLSQDYINSLRNFFFSSNSIYIIDNGHGMDSDTITNQWMQIGTGNKEENFISEDGRIKTGAKGIGRFALDRLGYISEMWTSPKGKNRKGSYWKMDWRRFDDPKIELSDVQAELEETHINFKEFLKQRFKLSSRILQKINKTDFVSGTIIKVSFLKDIWHENNKTSTFKSLEALIPPKELEIPFKVDLYSVQEPKLFGEVETAYFNDFDYKVEATFDSKKAIVALSITRDELDVKEVKTKFSSLFKKTVFPYDLRTLLNKKFETFKTGFEILKWEKNSNNSARLKNLGNFSLLFYYLKNTPSSKDYYPYKNYNTTERQKVLKRFGGIKIYRDSFRVRPYGEIGNDWLKLGDRAAQSPAGAGQRIGDWRVGPNQIAGLVKISRVENPNLVDKSDRGSLIENESFDILKKLVTGIINEFELDRSIILNPFFIEGKEKEKREREEAIRIEAEKMADKIIEERLKAEKKVNRNRKDQFKGTQVKQEKKSYQRIIEEGLQNFDKKDDEDAEISQVRTLASLGLIVSSFAHELKEVRNNGDDIIDLEKIYKKIADKKSQSLQIYKDGLDIIEALKFDNLKVAHWVEYSLTAIKKDKRKRTSLKFETFFNSLNKQWQKVLSDRNITLTIKNNIKKSYFFRAFEMDMSTIFSNLISNSIDSFYSLSTVCDREINIALNLVKNQIEITYSDNGAGLPEIFEKNKEEIFLPFTTSKKDKDGNDIGTGLGMYLVKTVINDNNGMIELIDTSVGFKAKIKFPTHKR